MTAASSRRVLVVDDDEFNCLVLRRMLPSPPYEVEVAVNGRAALEAARKTWPDAVLLDLEMPVMDGYQAAAKLRELQREGGRKKCMIVAISSNDEDAIVRRAIDAGCDHYLVKPAARDALLRILEGEVRPGGLEPVIFDPALTAALPAFLLSRREMLERMPAALERSRAEFRQLAHKLAGSFAMYGFTWAAAECRALQRDAESGEAGELGRRVAAVRAHLDQVRIETK